MQLNSGVRPTPESYVTYVEVVIEFLPPEAGGRSIPPDLSNDRPGSYKPHFRIHGGNGEFLGVEFVDGPDDPVQPGDHVHATVRALYEPEVSYAELTVGAAFDILEGRRVIGHGAVIRRD